MTAVKAHQAETFLKSPDPKLAAFLLYGSDEGLISERAEMLAHRLAKREQPEGEVLRLSDADLETDSDRLMVELGTVPMFGGRKIVRATAGRRINGPMLRSLVEGAPLAGVLIVEAGNLKPDDALRATFEKSPTCAAIACYGDDARDIEALVREVLGARKLTISADAKALLVARLGADRVMTRSEIEKLALYVAGKTHIAAEDVEAIVGDASEQTIDRLVNAAASGDAARTATEFARAIGAGESAQGLIAATERHFQRLHRLRTSLDTGRPFEDAIRALRPSVHFRQKDAVAAQCRQWTTPRLGAALARIATAARTARLAGPLEEAHAERLLLALAVMARAH